MTPSTMRIYPLRMYAMEHEIEWNKDGGLTAWQE